MKLSAVFPVAAAVAASAQSDPKPKIHWGVNIAEHGVMSAGNGIAATEDLLFVTNKHCSLVVLDRDTGNVTSVYQFEDANFPGTALICESVPLIYQTSDVEYVVFSSQEGHVIAANFDGTPRWNATVGNGPVENVQVDRVAENFMVAHNAEPNAHISFLSVADGSVDADRTVTIENETITGLSRSSGSSPSRYFFSGRATAKLYQIAIGSDDSSAITESLAYLGEPNRNKTSPKFPPLVSRIGSFPMHFVPSVNDTAVHTFLADNNFYDYRKTDDLVGAPLLLAEDIASDSAKSKNMICWGWFDFNCYDRDTGCPVWGRGKILNGVSGDPHLWVSRDMNSQTILFDNSRRGTFRSLDPVTGNDTWVLRCGDYDEEGYSCGSNTYTEGRGAMAVSPQRDIVYFSPGPGWIFAADVFLPPPTEMPTGAPTASAPSASMPTASIPTAAAPTAASPTAAPSSSPSAEPTPPSAARRILLWHSSTAAMPLSALLLMLTGVVW
uniref:Uncharacterized protein n=1 Tax=Pseudictyota dubia TaxID=2749911 RepID=A0A7R9W368_9STRA|mmetsp:Transcript_31343/g.57836  ORF Transcript_31343/g.57836 Transcript_31343/m.57836 type:complete len:497 (+) Transcript_31343:96-1586(+)